MKPLQLHVRGFTAFRQPTEIDFSDLDLFALVGPTGSGKSSLLDAMTFALYGRTARLGATGMDALISQGERSLEVNFTFEVGNETYRVARVRGRKTAENETRLERLSADGKAQNIGLGALKDINARIEEVVGLNFDNFTRCVMLPQGQFAAVLHGTSKERQKLLGDLIGLDVVEKMSKYAGSEVSGLKATANSLSAVLEREYAGVTEEAADAVRSQREALATQIEGLTQERESLLSRQTQLRELERLWRAQDAAQRQLQAEQTRAASVAANLERARQARRVAGVIPLLDQTERARLESERHAGELSALQTQAAQTAQAAAAAQAALEGAQRAEEGIRDLEARAELLKAAETDVARLKRAKVDAKLTHPDPLPWDEDAYEEAREGAQKLERLKAEREQLARRRTSFEVAKQTQKREEDEQQALIVEKGRIETEGKQARSAFQTAKKNLDAAREKVGILAYRHHLHEGEPCPLCLQIVETLPPADQTDIRALELEVERTQAELQSRLELHSELAPRIELLGKYIDERALSLRDTEAQLVQDEQDNRAAESRVKGNPEDDLQRLLATLAARVRQVGADPAGQRQKTLAQINALRRAVQDAQGAVTRTQSEAAATAASLQAAERQGAGLAERARELAEGLAAELRAVGLSAAEARAAGLPEREIAALEDAAREHQGKLAQLQAALDEVRQQLGGATFDPAELSQLLRDLTATEAALGNAQADSGKLAEQERNLRERLVIKAEKEAEAKAAAQKHDTWQTLANALKATEFQKYMLADTEAQLLTHAGELLHLISDGRYRLTLDKSDYAVQDLWNAGELRAVKTLSGGETFLASLALAIALSDYLAGSSVLGALFLDEGFGTLDPQALDAVATALENLRTQGRMVGIVTHVESLSERMPARLVVTKSMAGSQVMRLDG